MESPLRFQAAVAAVAITGAVLLARDRPPVEVAFAFQDKAIQESSGLVMTGGTVLTINDSGEEDAVVYVVNPRTGQTVGHTTYSTDHVADVEAVTTGPGGSIWVGDIGDNGADRDHVSVYELPPVEAGEHTVTARRYDLVYSDGPRDAETLLVDPRTGRLHVVTKGLFGGRVYEGPPTLRTDRPNVLRPVARAGGLATDG